ncbi:dihydrodipicolinate synthase [Chania multitudinisentens RB-25]|uniref:Dihydrodipicolinate synthase n=1 Tax=Chania multitudinisentens RB-25 TaxID=1441930 RepID=W0LHR1_9GAMM|nr:dihydrodipicolinate synthase family protein [Chania multitudinisentens]AHG21525.1 dihydrodipicolinate synthase [Chania multitudinisentens RB-25]
MHSSYITPTVTVFDKKGRLDSEENLKLYDFIKEYMSGFVVMGSTGEFFSLSVETSRQLIKLASGFNKGHLKVYAGASRMDVNESISLANYAYECGLDGVMIISPYYFRLTDEGIYDFYSKIAKNTKANIFIYNFPEKTGYSISPEICLKLATAFPNIIGFKDTIPDTMHTCEIIKQVKKELPYFEVYAGYDNNFAHNILSGGNGCIGGLSNIIPEFFKSWIDAFASNDLLSISTHQQTVDKMMDIYHLHDPFISTLKKTLQLRGIINSDFIYPPFSPVAQEKIASIASILSLANVQIKTDNHNMPVIG